ncbi:UNVERIFIED_CONTAM: putative protein YciO [Sesamum calycinum]|uniref:Threonylcarbamoyl-AMP synthase n=1 Tax=Sesamum calycinum TaxID=2727403 RepID=A0AAW2SUC0_9LAMI
MAVLLRPLAGDAAALLSFPRSLNPCPCRTSFHSPSNISRRFITFAVVKRSPKRLKYSSPRFTKEDGLLYVEVDPSGADTWKLDPIVELLKQGAVGVIPTDTVYAIACDLRNNSAIERLRSRLAFYVTLSKTLTHTLQDFLVAMAKYTFILTASKELPKQCIRYGTTASKYASRKNVGVRIPDDPVCQAILEKMEAPLYPQEDFVHFCLSVKSPKENEWILDPVVIADVYGPEGLDFVVAAGTRVADPSTVVDMTGSLPRIIRLGKGPKQPWMVAEDEEDPPVNEDHLVPGAA